MNHQVDLVPLHARVIIERHDTPERIGLIHIPKTSEEVKPTEGVVLAIGDGCERLKVGDTVFFGRYSGFSFQRDGKNLVFCNEEDVLAIVTGNGAKEGGSDGR